MKQKLIQNLLQIKKIKKLQRILVTGSQGQIGTDLLPALSFIYGSQNILATDLHQQKNHLKEIPFQIQDVLDQKLYIKIAEEFQPSIIIHLPAILSGNAEKNFQLGLQINIMSFLNAIEATQKSKSQLFVPSSIAAFGFDSLDEAQNVKEGVYQRPKTMYGIAKVLVELVGEYVKQKKDIDFRSLRYPGVFSNIMPSGGTTDYSTCKIKRNDF